MKSKIPLMVIIAVIVVSFVLGMSADAQMQRPTRVAWEYKDAANLSPAQLNVFGNDGWELVTVSQFGRDFYYVFKRIK